MQSEVKEEKWAAPISGDMSGARHPGGAIRSIRRRGTMTASQGGALGSPVHLPALAPHRGARIHACVRAGRGRRVGGSVHVPRPWPSAKPSSFTSLRRPPDTPGRAPLAVFVKPLERRPIAPVGCRAERSKGGEMGSAHFGGHERRTAPRRRDPLNSSQGNDDGEPRRRIGLAGSFAGPCATPRCSNSCVRSSGPGSPGRRLRSCPPVLAFGQALLLYFTTPPTRHPRPRTARCICRTARAAPNRAGGVSCRAK